MQLYYSQNLNLCDLRYADRLPAERRTRLARYIRPADQLRCLTAGLMLRAVLGEGYETRLETGPYGKPGLRGGAPFFNLSHGGDYVILAVSACAVGADIEPAAADPPADTRLILTPAERHWLAGQREPAAFYRLWTGKESVVKAIGTGLQLPLNAFEVLPVSDGVHRICGADWLLRWTELDGHVICTAADPADWAAQTICLGRDELIGCGSV